jgi:hypothetical protein
MLGARRRVSNVRCSAEPRRGRRPSPWSGRRPGSAPSSRSQLSRPSLQTARTTWSSITPWTANQASGPTSRPWRRRRRTRWRARSSWERWQTARAVATASWWRRNRTCSRAKATVWARVAARSMGWGPCRTCWVIATTSHHRRLAPDPAKVRDYPGGLKPCGRTATRGLGHGAPASLIRSAPPWPITPPAAGPPPASCSAAPSHPSPRSWTDSRSCISRGCTRASRRPSRRCSPGPRTCAMSWCWPQPGLRRARPAPSSGRSASTGGSPSVDGDAPRRA